MGLFASARWGLFLDDVREVHNHLYQRLSERLPLVLLQCQVGMSELAPPKRDEDFGSFVRAYEKYVRGYKPYTSEPPRDVSLESIRVDPNTCAECEDSCVSRYIFCLPCDTSALHRDISATVHNHLQCRLASFVRYRIFEAQDFLAICTGPDTEGNFTAESNQIYLRICEALRPWIILYMKLCKHPHSEKIRHTRVYSDKELRGASVVYARFNLSEGSLYIGETEKWTERQKQHYKATWKHSTCMKQGMKCTGCAEHKKYLGHRVVRPAQWIMLPMGVYADKVERKRVEGALERRWKPNLNKWDNYKRTFAIAQAKDLWVRVKKPLRSRSGKRGPGKKVCPESQGCAQSEYEPAVGEQKINKKFITHYNDQCGLQTLWK